MRVIPTPEELARAPGRPYPVSVITDGMGLNITVMSYCGSMDFGIVADRDQMPDLATFMPRLKATLKELRKASKRRDEDAGET